jgi:hypothetical protein
MQTLTPLKSQKREVNETPQVHSKEGNMPSPPKFRQYYRKLVPKTTTSGNRVVAGGATLRRDSGLWCGDEGFTLWQGFVALEAKFGPLARELGS